MVCVGIDVAKDKHDCCILDSDGMVRADCFTTPPLPEMPVTQNIHQVEAFIRSVKPGSYFQEGVA